MSGQAFPEIGGAQITNSEHILFLDCDVLLEDSSIDQLYEYLQGNEKTVVQPFPCSGIADIEVEKSTHNHLLSEGYEDIGDIGEIENLYSFCFLISRELYFEARGFSAYFTITHEDIEFGKRLLGLGAKIYCLKSVKVNHHHTFGVEEYFARCIKNGDSFARFTDVAGDRKNHRYVSDILNYRFKNSIESLDSEYRELRKNNSYDQTIFSEITYHYWIEGITQYYSKPTITVAIPIANNVDKLRRTLNSLKKQLFLNFEVVLVHTDSVDMPELNWQEQQSLSVYKQTTGKLAHAMNIARNISQGQYFTWVQCGDLVDERYLLDLVNEFFLDQSTSISFCGYRFFGLSEHLDGWVTRFQEDKASTQLIECFKKWNIVGPGFMVRTGTGISYCEDNWLSEDWDFYLQNALLGRIRFVNKPLYLYWDHEDSLSRQVGWRAEDDTKLRQDQELALRNFRSALENQTVCAAYVIRNEDYFIEESILSVIDQVSEVCIIDTGSNDSTLQIIDRIKQTHPCGSKIQLHHRIIYNYNVSRFRNEVAELTNCHWIMIVDGDEIWPYEQLERFLEEMRDELNYQRESLQVYQKRWSSMLEQQTNFAYLGSMIRAYRRSYRFIWRQSETIDFFIGEKRLENQYCIDLDKNQALEKIIPWLSQCIAEIELQSVEYAYRNFDGNLSDNKKELDVYFDHFSRCKGDLYLRDRVERIHQKHLGTQDYINFDRSYNQNYEAFIPLKQHATIRKGVSLLIPHYNNLDGLEKCLNSIRLHHPGIEYEIIIINDRVDNELNLERYTDLPFRIVSPVSRAGFANAVNLGIRTAKYDHIAILNDDIVVVSKNWARKIIDALNSSEKYAVAGPLTNRTGGYPPVQYSEHSHISFSDCDDVVKDIDGREIEEIHTHKVLSGFVIL